MNDRDSIDPVLPPAERSPLWEEMNAAADAGLLRLQVCGNCARVQYPPRDLCENCLGDELEWSEVEPGGTVLSFTRLHASHVPFFRNGGPWPLGLVKLDCGVLVYVHLCEEALQTGSRVEVVCQRDASGQAVLVGNLP